MNRSRTVTPLRIAALVAAALLPHANAADIVLTPPVAGGMSVTNAAGSVTRWRIGEDGAVTVPGALRITQGASATTIILGADVNSMVDGVKAATIGGGGASGSGFSFGLGLFGCSMPNSCENRVTQHGGTVGGGIGNQAGDAGQPPSTTQGAATVAGGLANAATGGFSTIAGGWGNVASGANSTVIGGLGNTASGDSAAVLGGRNNSAIGNFSVAAGFGARAPVQGAFVWADAASGQWFDATTQHEFAARATGGFRFVTAVDGTTGAPTRTFALGANGRMTVPDDFAIYRGANRFAHATGASNAFLGHTAGNAIATGFENAALGHEALLANTDGAGNTAVGYRAMVSMTTAFNSTAIGAQSLANATGAGNIALGAFAGANVTTGGSNIMIGHGGDAADNATTRIGGSQTRAFIAGIRGVTTSQPNGVQVFIDSNGQLGTASSSRATKQDIADMGEASDVLMQLRPVTFRYRSHVAAGKDALQYGLVAEEVAEVAPALAAHSADGRIETVNYQFLAPMLVNEVQVQRRVIAEQAARIDALAGELAAIRSALGLR